MTLWVSGWVTSQPIFRQRACLHMGSFPQPRHFFAAAQENKDLRPSCRGSSQLLIDFFVGSLRYELGDIRIWSIKNLSHILAVSGAWNDTFLAFLGPWNHEKPYWSFQGPDMKLFWHFQGPEMAPFWLFQAPEIRWSLFGVIRGLKLSYFGIFWGLKMHLIGWKRWYCQA